MKHLILFLFILTFLSVTSYTQWIQHTDVPSTASVTDIEVYGEHMYLITSTGVVYHSMDCGEDWAVLTTGFPANTRLNDIFFKDSVLYLVGTGVYRSTNLGMNWTSIGTGIADTVTFLFQYQGKLYAVTNGSGIYSMKEDDTTWTMANFNGLPANSTITSFEKAGRYLFIGVADHGIFRSENKGKNWTAVNNGLLPNSTPTTMMSWGNRLFAALSNSGVYFTSNYGMNWIMMSDSIVATGNTFSDLMKIESYLVIGASGGVNAVGRGFYVSDDKGETWMLMNDSFTVSGAYNVQAIAVCDSTLFAGTGAGLWYRDLDEVVNDDFPFFTDENPLPDKPILLPNYPNPFNPVTNIRFQLGVMSNVKLIVFDILGREVATLVNSQLQPGSHDVLFDASHLSSGIYYYKLTTDNFTDTKRMILVK